MAHSRLAPSKAHQWLHCPGSLNLEAQVPEEPSSPFAAEGTAAHLVRSECLDFGLEPYDFVGKTITVDGFPIEVTEDMAEYLQPGIDRCRDWDGREYIEQRVSLRRWLLDTSGTLDYGRVGHKVIRVNDLKFGAGVIVDVTWNAQLLIYAAGFWDNIAKDLTWAEDFELSIDQPRVVGKGGDAWHVKLDDVREFMGWAKYVGKQTEDPEAPRVPGEKQCLWCRAKGICPEYAAFNLKTVSLKFENLDGDDAPVLPNSLTITPERRTYIIRHSDMLREFLDLQYAEAMNDASAGRPVPGMKVVTGRSGMRKWIDESAAIAVVEPLFGEDAFTKRLISPTQVEKKLGKKVMKANETLQSLVTQSDGKPCLVPDTDPREAIKPVSDRFEDLTGGEANAEN